MSATRRGFAALISGSVAAAALGPGAPAFAAAEVPPNVFISPHGRPYRAPAGAPYPIADWFRDADRNGDGKLDQAEFLADAAAFFEFLDQNGDGALDGGEIAFYEHRIAPEVLGMRVTVLADGRMLIRPDRPRLWLAQYGPMEGGALGPLDQGQGPEAPGGPGQPRVSSDPSEGQVVPKEALPDPRPAPNPLTGVGGASPFSLIREPEPVTAADSSYVVSGLVRKASFMAQAQAHFAFLDPGRAGYLTRASLPQTPVEKLLGAIRKS